MLMEDVVNRVVAIVAIVVLVMVRIVVIEVVMVVTVHPYLSVGMTTLTTASDRVCWWSNHTVKRSRVRTAVHCRIHRTQGTTKTRVINASRHPNPVIYLFIYLHTEKDMQTYRDIETAYK